MVNSTTTVCTGSDGRMSADGGIDRKNRYNSSATIAKAEK